MNTGEFENSTVSTEDKELELAWEWWMLWYSLSHDWSQCLSLLGGLVCNEFYCGSVQFSLSIGKFMVASV